MHTLYIHVNNMCILDTRYLSIGGYHDIMVWDMISMWSNICNMWYYITCMECTYTRICPCTCMHTHISYVHTLLTWLHHIIMNPIWSSGCCIRCQIPYTWYVCKYHQICHFVPIRYGCIYGPVCPFPYAHIHNGVYAHIHGMLWLPI